MVFSSKRPVPHGGRNTGLGGGRVRRTIVSLGALTALGISLAVLNVVTSRRDLVLATGPPSAAQRAWLVEAADRPDVAQFFKKLPHEGRVAMAQAVGRYDDAALAKLCGILLADFDAEARANLVAALKRIVAVHPEAVAAQLAQKGSFQNLGVSEALRTLGVRALPSVAAMLDNADARPTAVDYLVGSGEAAIPSLLSRLDDPKPEVALAAADALGGLRARDAVAPLLRRLEEATPAERPDYLSAISAIGDPSTAALLEATLCDPTRPLPERAAASVGLGRIGGPEIVRTLWTFAVSEEPVLADAAFAALVAAGPSALDVQDAPPSLRIRLAGGFSGVEADAVLRTALGAPATRLAAARAAQGHPALVPDLVALLPAARDDGDLASALVGSLCASPQGSAGLAPYRADPALSGFIARATD